MDASTIRDLSPQKRRALVGSFVLGGLVIAFFAAVLSVLPVSPARSRDAAQGVERRDARAVSPGETSVSLAR